MNIGPGKERINCCAPSQDDPLGQRCLRPEYEALRLKYVGLMVVALELSSPSAPSPDSKLAGVLVDFMMEHSPPREILEAIRAARSDFRTYKARAEEKLKARAQA